MSTEQPLSRPDTWQAGDREALAAVLGEHRLVGPDYRPIATTGLSHVRPYANGDWSCACGVGGNNGWTNHMSHVAAALAVSHLSPRTDTERVDESWEYGFTHLGPNGVTRTEWGFAKEPVPDSDGELEVYLDEWVTVTSTVRRRFAPAETVTAWTAEAKS